MNNVKIGKKIIGGNFPCFIIAEIGSNHNRNFKTALKMIDAAKEAKADAVKFQTYSAEKMYSRYTPKPKYLNKGKVSRKDESVWELIKRIEMPREWHKDLAKYCRKKDIIFLSTPFDLEAVDELEKVKVPAYKIASFEITHLPLLEKVGKTKKPIILSTGMADLEDIKLALKTIYKHGNKNVILLHCAIGYPPKFNDLNLRAMETMRKTFKIPVGFSDHTLGITSSVAAAALGACVIEKHFTLSRKQKGPDHSFALEPDELKNMVQAIRDTEDALGSPIKKHTNSENELYKLARRSLVSACEISKGSIITEEMIEVKRPGYGIHPKFICDVIGKKARRNIREDEILKWSMIY